MNEPIDLINHAALKELRSFTLRTGQPTDIGQLDLAPMEHVTNIEITEEHVTITYNEKTTHRYNVNEVTHKEWSYKYNDDREFVAAIGAQLAGWAAKILGITPISPARSSSEKPISQPSTFDPAPHGVITLSGARKPRSSHSS